MLYITEHGSENGSQVTPRSTAKLETVKEGKMETKRNLVLNRKAPKKCEPQKENIVIHMKKSI